MLQSFLSKHKNLILLVIVLLGTFLRFYRLGQIPMGMFGDEVDAGYNAYSFLHTGRDYNGNWLPIHFESMGDYRAFLFIWSLIPGISMFGLNAFGVRFAPAVFGSVAIPALYWLSRKIGFSVNKSLFASFILAILPWHLHYSRAAFEVTLMTTLLMLSVGFFISGLRRPGLLILAAALFAINAYSYNVAKLFSPLLLCICAGLYVRQLKVLPRTYLVASIGIFILLLAPLAYDTVWGKGNTRFQGINILNSPGFESQINYERGQDGDFQSLPAKIAHNKLISAAIVFGQQYSNAFSPKVLFFAGDEQLPRHSLPGFGFAYAWMWPLMFLGFVYMINNYQRHPVQFTALWLAIAPIPSALTQGGGQHATRLSPMIPPLIFVCIFGAVFVLQIITALRSYLQNMIKFAVIGAACLSFSFYLHQYYYHYSQTHYRWWNYGMEQAMTFIHANEDKYADVVMTRAHSNNPLLYYLFYTAYPPEKLHQQFAANHIGQAPSPTDQIGKLRFATLNNEDTDIPGLLYVAAPWEYTDMWQEIGRVSAPDPMETSPVFMFLEPRPLPSSQ